MGTLSKTPDEVNRKTWRSAEVVKNYGLLYGWTDPGERAALDCIREEMHDRPILDIGVGAGRTAELLLPISSDYVGIDYTPEMVDACRRRFPSLRFLLMDARDLGEFDDQRFALVVFSFNGIDSVSHADRPRILEEVARVLQPDGVFVFSAHNRDGPGCGEHPRLRIQFNGDLKQMPRRVLSAARSFVSSMYHHSLYRSLGERHDGWATMNCGAHDFGIVIDYNTLQEQARQLACAGFALEGVFESSRGHRVTATTPTADAWWLHYVARKTATSTTAHEASASSTAFSS